MKTLVSASVVLSTAALSLVVLMVAPAKAQYVKKTVAIVVYTSANGAGDQVLSPGYNNSGDTLWAGQTQGGPRVFLNSLLSNVAAQVAGADTIVDSRLPRFGTNSQNAVWNASTGEIDPVTKLASPGSGYEEDRIYLYNPSVSTTPNAIYRTELGPSIVTSPDVNDAGQATFRKLDFGTGQWSLFAHDGSGTEAGTTSALTNWSLVNTTFINNAGTIAFFGRRGASDPLSFFNYSIGTGTLTGAIPSLTLANPALRDYSDDGVGLLFDGGNATGSFYTIDGTGKTTKLLTAGTNGLSRLELGGRNKNGTFLFANRTVLGAGGANPTDGRSDLYISRNGVLKQLTSSALGTSISAAAINDRGDVAYVERRYLYDTNGVYTGQREFKLVVAQAAPEPGTLALTLFGLVMVGGVTLRSRHRA